MNREEIVAQLNAKGIHASLDADQAEMTVKFSAAGRPVELKHKFPDRLSALPAFVLVDPEQFGTLAHVVGGLICVVNRDSVSVNYEVPPLLYEDSAKRHIALVTRLIEDPAWNRYELLREFQSNWNLVCVPDATDLFCFSDSETPYTLQVKLPERKAKYGIRASHFALSAAEANDERFDQLRSAIRWDKRQAVGKCIVVTLPQLEPAPTKAAEVAVWYADAVSSLEGADAAEFAKFTRQTHKDFWVVFRAETPSGITMAAVRLQARNEKKGPLPTTAKDCEPWHVEPIQVRSLNRDALVPRGGGSLDLAKSSVLLVGCGSVGSEIAHLLASAGVGSLTIADKERFEEQNLYRHTLALGDIGYAKRVCVAADLRLRFPWISTEPSPAVLSNWAEQSKLESFDLVVVAIGSPTEERLFHDSLRQLGATCPVLNTWLEAFGIGGHAILDLPGSKGCFRCAYVDPEELTPGLASNLNFLEPNQDVTVTHAGCGDQYLPYSGIASSYTATIAADLATRFLLGRVDQSTKVSWKGDSKEAEARGFRPSYRFHHFEGSLELLPLYNDECDVCSG